jgi:hypothetical protein
MCIYLTYFLSDGDLDNFLELDTFELYYFLLLY